MLAVVLMWAFQKIIDKRLISGVDSKEFTKWTVVFHFILVVPLLFFIKVPDLISVGIVALLSLITLLSTFYLFKGVKRDEIGRVTPFYQFSIIFAVLLSTVFFGEKVSIGMWMGIVLMVFGGVGISVEKSLGSIKEFISHNKAILFVFFAAFLSGFNTFINKYLLTFALSAFTLLVLRRLFTFIMVLPTIRRKIAISNWGLFLLSRALSTYGLLLFFWILSKQTLSLTVPLLAVQPLVVALLSKGLLQESHSVKRVVLIILIVLGYYMIKAF
jgi:drug/metabolite transporter (DMT)-like permease